MASADIDSEPDFVDTPTNDIVPSFSFSGCGFLGVYHVGVATCLREHTDVINRPEIRFAGASAGALVATTLLCGVDFGEMTKLLLEVAEVVRDRENVDLGNLLKDVMKQYLPDDAHIRLRNRLYISVTLLNGVESGLITEFQSKDHLIQCLLASSFVPGFTGWVPPSLAAEHFVTTEKTFPVYLGEPRRKQKNITEDDGDCLTRNEKEKQKLDSCDSSESSKRSESVWDVFSDDKCTDCSVPAAPEKSTKENNDGKTCLKMLVDLCHMSLSTTSKVVRKVPLASRVVNSVIPKNLTVIDEFFEAILLELMSDKYMSLDGGFSDNLPSFDCNTITVSPFAGESDICPRDMIALDLSFELGNTSMQLSGDNAFRLSHALNPMEPAMLLKLCEEGYNACLRFLHNKDLLGCKKHLMTRAILSSSPCNIGHAHCTCALCQASDAKIKSSLSCVNCQRVKQKALTSCLPDDVQLEFKKAIQSYTKKSQPSNFLNRLTSTLWWIVEQMFSGTVKVADLAIDFSAWLLRFLDNVSCLMKYTLLPLGQKRKLVRYILSSLRTSLSANKTKSRSRVPVTCSLNKLQSLCS